MSIQYERLQIFRYKCGRIGHNGSGCKDSALSGNKEGDNEEFSPWLSASAVKTLEENVEI